MMQPENDEPDDNNNSCDVLRVNNVPGGQVNSFNPHCGVVRDDETCFKVLQVSQVTKSKSNPGL